MIFTLFKFGGQARMEPKKQHVCKTCGKKYYHQPNLSRHRKFECQKEKSFLCPFCNYASYHKYQLKSHVICQHKEKYSDFLSIK
ncbi:hypothetical protein GWI33_014857 [Rhynchophorus ferrugineus]|uniref:C2H2-type domain-containing protein n=1 Tax=Rhynchophorus ferrugineus TaxID=354439 RepID=A0A834M6G1_RHYFE|nr:hypothetical protein GWI33_014857 [Rhynchophorus ferrugineus]